MDPLKQQEFEKNLHWYERFVINVIKCGEIPKHIAIIADGNRRYAKERKIKQRSSYDQGMEKFIKGFGYLAYLGIQEITLFALSIENFKRDPAEFEVMMDLAIEKANFLLAQRDQLAAYDVCLRFIGDITLVPIKLRKLIIELVLFTKDHKGPCLNICISYTSSYELSSAAYKLYNAVNQNVVSDEISVEDLNACLLTNLSRMDPDVLLRTSGEIRFSDFLLMQCNYSRLLFTPCLWPEINAFEVFKLIIRYQMGQRFKLNTKARKVIKSNERPPNPKLVAHLDAELEKSLREMLVQ